MAIISEVKPLTGKALKAAADHANRMANLERALAAAQAEHNRFIAQMKAEIEASRLEMGRALSVELGMTETELESWFIAYATAPFGVANLVRFEQTAAPADGAGALN